MEYKPNEITAEYRKMATSYDAGSTDCNWSAPSVVRENLTQRGLLKPNSHIIDFAAGTGLLSQELRDTIGGGSLHITALDLSHDMLDQLRTKRIANVLRSQDITKPWNVQRGQFDLAAATGVGEYLTDHQLKLTIGHAAETLKQDGHLAFTYRPDGTTDDAQKLHDPNAVRTIFEKAGLKILEEKPFDAYSTDDGTVIKHQYILAQKL